MLRRPRSHAALGGVLVLAVALAGCGSDDGDSTSESAGLDSVTIEGKAGKEPTVAFDGRLGGDEITSKVVIEGDGETIEPGDNVLAQLWIGNGFTEQAAYSTWSGSAQLLNVGGELSEPLSEALEGHKVGSRVAVLSSAEESFGESGNPEIGIGNKDSVLWVVDITGTVLSGPEGEDRDPAPWAPGIEEKDGNVTGLDFSQGEKPSGKLRSTTIVKGSGAKVEKGQTIHVNYLGQVYDAKEPFDESYSTGQPASFPIGVGGVVPGWDKELVGLNVGSRMILEIPPAEGYGEEGNKDAGIKGTDTLYFVVDILGAS